MSGHIRQRSPGSFELRYFLGTDPATGKRKYATATIKGSRKDAEKELRRLLRALDIGGHVDPNRITVRDWLATWLEIIRQEVSPKTHERYGEIVNHFLAPALGSVQLAKLAPVHIQGTYSALADSGRRDGKSGGLAPRTRRHIHRILSSALARAVEQQLIARNPAEIFRRRLPKVEHHKMTTLRKRRTMRALGTVWQRRYNLDSGAAENGRRGQKTGFVLGLSCAVFGVKTKSGRDQTQPCASRVFLAITKLASANRVRSCAVFLARPR